MKKDYYMEKIGEVWFGNKIDITDPCYDREVWCRMNDVEIKPGNYTCYIRKVPYPYNTKVFVNGAISIFKDNIIKSHDDMYLLGTIGVDSGRAGFFINDPNYLKNIWHDFWDCFDNEKLGKIDEGGFCACTAYGDGSYPVYCHKDASGVIDALEINCDY